MFIAKIRNLGLRLSLHQQMIDHRFGFGDELLAFGVVGAVDERSEIAANFAQDLLPAVRGDVPRSEVRLCRSENSFHVARRPAQDQFEADVSFYGFGDHSLKKVKA